MGREPVVAAGHHRERYRAGKRRGEFPAVMERHGGIGISVDDPGGSARGLQEAGVGEAPGLLDAGVAQLELEPGPREAMVSVACPAQALLGREALEVALDQAQRRRSQHLADHRSGIEGAVPGADPSAERRSHQERPRRVRRQRLEMLQDRREILQVTGGCPVAQDAIGLAVASKRAKPKPSAASACSRNKAFSPRRSDPMPCRNTTQVPSRTDGGR